MQLIYPNYYPLFQCRAGNCSHTCCSGWEIDIDEDSMARYASIPSIMAQIDSSDEVSAFRLRENGDCPFLNADGLCNMILEYGEEMLCDICTLHPRFCNDMTSRTEIGLGLCCEAAAELILTQEGPFTLCIQTDGESFQLNEDEASVLSVRDRILETLDDTHLTVSERVLSIEKDLNCPFPDMSGDNAFAQLDRLECLDPSWKNEIMKLKLLPLFGIPNLSGTFGHAAQHLAIYFIYRHLAPAAEDGCLEGRLRMCMFLWRTAVNLIALSGPYDVTRAADICRMLSAEIEYSDENIRHLIDSPYQ